MKIPYRRVNRDATELFRSGEGYNLYAMEVEQFRDIYLVHTGFALDIPEGYMGFVFTHPVARLYIFPMQSVELELQQ